MWSRSATVAIAVLAAVAGISACGTTGGVEPGERVTVYVSAPLRGPEADRGRRAIRAARRVLADADGMAGELRVRAVFLDDTEGAEWTPVKVAQNARASTEDSTAVAYVGELDPRATTVSRAITDQAGLLQVAPAGGRSMAEVLDAIEGAGDAGDDREAVRDAWDPTGG